VRSYLIRGDDGIRFMKLSNQETIKAIREQLKAIKQAITAIEFKLSQLESESQAPGPERAAATGEAPAWS